MPKSATITLDELKDTIRQLQMELLLPSPAYTVISVVDDNTDVSISLIAPASSLHTPILDIIITAHPADCPSATIYISFPTSTTIALTSPSTRNLMLTSLQLRSLASYKQSSQIRLLTWYHFVLQHGLASYNYLTSMSHISSFDIIFYRTAFTLYRLGIG